MELSFNEELTELLATCCYFVSQQDQPRRLMTSALLFVDHRSQDNQNGHADMAGQIQVP